MKKQFILTFLLASFCMCCFAFGVYSLSANSFNSNTNMGYDPGNAQYTTEYYFENIDDDGYTLDSTKTSSKSETVGQNVSAETLSFDGFVFDENNSLNVKAGKVEIDTPLTLKLYYKRKTTNVNFSMNNGLSFTGSEAGSYKFGQTVNLAGNVTDGTFVNWSTDGSGTLSDAENISTTYIITKEDCDKTINFVGNMKYLQTVLCGENGTITPSENFYLNYGGNTTISVNPSTNYEVDTFKINGISQALTDNSYTLTNISSTNIIAVTFKEQATVGYKVEYYLENLDGTYTLKDSDNKSGYVGENVQIDEKTFEDYEENLTHSDRVISGEISEDGNLVLRRYYNLKTNLLSFNSSNGTGTMSSQTLKIGESITLPANSFAKTGYKFIGWATTENGEVVYTNEQTLEMGAQNIILYAVWAEDKEEATISFAQANITKTYGDASFTNALTNTGDGVVTYSTNSSCVTVNNAGLVTIVGVGTATITATVSDTENYTYPTKTAEFTITVNANTNGTVEVAQKVSKIYDGSEQTINASDLTVTLNGNIVTNFTISGKTSGTNADDYEITVTISSGEYTGSTKDAVWTIDKKQTTITFAQNSITKTYGDAKFTNAITNTGDGVVTYTSNSEAVATVNSTTGEVTVIGVGTATITAAVADSANCAYAVKTVTYVVTVNANTNGKITVTQKNAKTYTGTTIELSKADLTVTLNGSQATNYTLTGTTSGVNAGEYEVTITINSGNYVGSKTTFDWVIGKKQATISFAQANITKTYGDANFTNALTNTGDGVVSYKSSTNNVTVSSDGLVTIVKAGTAIITATVSDSANYTYTNKTATYTITINPKQLDAPTNVIVSTDGEISWNAVSNAETYEVGIDELSYWSNVGKDLSYNFKNAITEKTGTRTIYVRAKGGDNYATSENASKQVVVYALSLDKTTGVESVSGAGNYIEGASASISASVKAHYTFTGWTGTENISSNENVLLMTSSKTLTANTQAINYNITWEKEDATWVKEPIATYNIETSLITLPERDDVSRYGYALIGWKVGETNYDLGESVTFENLTNNAYGNITIAALWKEVNFNITFTAYLGDTDTKFIDWDIYSLQGAVYINNENIDVSDKYSITFGDSTSINSIREIIDFKVNALNSSCWNPQKADYVVMYYNGKNITGKTVELSEDTNIEVRFYKDGEGPGQYAEVTIMLDSNLGVIASHVDWTGTTNSVTKTIESNTAIGELPTATREGYEFIGWFTEKTIGTGTQITETTTFTTNTTLYAHFTKYITITFDAGANGIISTAPNGEWEGSGRYATKKVKVGESFGVIPENNYLSYALQGYRDLGWWTSPYQSSGESIGSSKIVTFDRDTTIYAKWTNEVYVSFYVYDDESCEFKIYGYSNNTTTGRTIVFPGDEKEEYYFPGCNKDPEREGYKFLGWYDAETGGNKIEKGSKVPYDAGLSYRLYAQWEQIGYKVTLSKTSYDGTVSGEFNSIPSDWTTSADTLSISKIYSEGATLGELPTVTCSDSTMTFIGWYTASGTEATSSTKVTAGASYYAKFGPITITITLSYLPANNSAENITGSINSFTDGWTEDSFGFAEKSFKYGDVVGELISADANDVNYYLEGWYTLDGSEKLTSETIVTVSKAYYARYTLKQYDVTLIVNSTYRVPLIDESWNSWTDNSGTTWYKRYIAFDELIDLPICYDAGTGAQTTKWGGGIGIYNGKYSCEGYTDIYLTPVWD